MCNANLVLRNYGVKTLPDSTQWELRFEIPSETSDNIYIIARHKKNKNWACSCFGYRRYRRCKHLEAIKQVLNAIDRTGAENTAEEDTMLMLY